MVLVYYLCTVRSCVLTGQVSEIFKGDAFVLGSPFENMLENIKFFTCDNEYICDWKNFTVFLIQTMLKASIQSHSDVGSILYAA